MAEPEVEAFLKYLAVNRDVSLGTQRVALNAVVFLYRHVLDKPLADLEIAPAKARKHIPTVFSHQEAVNLIRQLDGVYRLIAQLMYGTGLRINETLRLRVKDIDFDNT